MRSLILETSTRTVFHTIVLFSLYLLFAGHNAPGGGFVGGLVAGAALVLLYVSIGAHGLRRVVRAPAEAVLGLGVLLAVGTGGVALLLGAEFLQSGMLVADVPLLGEVHLTSVLAFDVGVYLVVVGLVLAVLHSLGGEREGPR